MGRPMIPSPIIPMVCAMVTLAGAREWGDGVEPATRQITRAVAASQARTAKNDRKRGFERGDYPAEPSFRWRRTHSGSSSVILQERSGCWLILNLACPRRGSV